MNTSLKKSWGRNLLVIAILLMFSHFINAQENYILYGFRGVPQSMSLNPALTPDASLFIGIPAISNIEIGLLNTVGNYNDFFTRKPGSTVDNLDMSKVIQAGNNLGFTKISINEDLLSAGFKIKNNFFTIGVSQRMSFTILSDNDLFKLIWNDNTVNAGTTLYLNNTAIEETHMLDYHVGLSVPVTTKVTIGTRIHLLQGLSNIQTKNDGMNFTTQSDGNGGYDVYASSHLLLNTSGFQNNSNNNNNFNPGQYLSDFKNMGFAIDLGAAVKVTDQLNVSASVLDLGAISYHSNTQSYRTDENNVNLTGSLSEIFKSNNALSGLGDSLKRMFNASEFSNTYSVKLPTRLYIGAEYNLKQNGGRVSLLFASQFFKGYNNMAASLGYDYSLGKHFNFKVNYTYIKEDPFNVGTALSFQFKPIQLYLYTDNILTVSWKSSKYAQFGFGLNILFPNKNGEKKKLAPNAQTDIIEP
ncbi:MAG: hypothetical protein IH595_06015 [Bacteroidales bacterium]|nr:hypothetical protein [Bacteroidales bacterium]